VWDYLKTSSLRGPAQGRDEAIPQLNQIGITLSRIASVISLPRKDELYESTSDNTRQYFIY